MSGLLDTIAMGGQALQAQQRGAQVSGNNISNAATPGYHRQDVNLESNPYAPHGVRVASVDRAVDSILGGRLRDQSGEAAYANERATLLSRLEASWSPLQDGGIAQAVDNFFSGWRQLADAPSDATARQQVLASSEHLATAVSDSALTIHAEIDSANTQIAGRIDEANTLLSRVAKLNRSITVADSQGQPALELQDERDRHLQSLANLVGAESFEDDRQQMTVMIGGLTVVQGDHASVLEATPDSVTGMHSITVQGSTHGPIDARLGGQVGALVDVRDTDLPALLTSLDSFAFDFATAANTVHSAGAGLDGAFGRPLFSTTATSAGAAAAFSVDSAIAADPSLLATALDPGAVSGDNRQALAMVSLASQNIASGGTQTPESGLRSIIGSLGNMAQNASGEASLQADQLAIMEQFRQEQSGISIEEQMLNMNRFQRAFQAASRVITTVDEMMETLLRM